METDLKQIRTKLIEALQFGYIIFIIPALAASFLRIAQTGWHWTYLVQIFAAIMAVLMYLFRSKCSLAVKTHLSCIFLMLVCFQGAFRLGISGAIYYCALSVLIAVLIAGKRTGLVYAIISISGLITIAFLHHFKIINTNVDFNVYNFSFTAWLNALIGLIFFLIMSIISIGLFYEYFNRSIATLIHKSKEQEIIQAELKESEERYRLLINNALIPVILTNYNGDLLFVNKAAEKLFGIPLNELTVKSILPFWSDINARKELVDELKLYGVYENKEAIFYNLKGEKLSLILSSNTIVYNEKPSILTVLYDTTNQKAAEIISRKNELLTIEKERAEISELNTKELLKQLTKSKEAIESSEKRYKQAQEIGKIGSWEYDLKNKLFWGSAEAKRIYGFTSDSTSYNFDEVTKCVVDRELNDQALDDLLKGKKSYNIVFNIRPYCSDEIRTIHSVAELVKDELGVSVKITGIIQDITERTKIEKELKDSETRYRTIVENAMMGIAIRRGERLLFVNHKFCEMTGYSERELISMDKDTFLSTYHPDDQNTVHQRFLDLSVTADVPKRFEIRKIHKNGNVIWVDKLINNVKYGDIEAQLVMYLDITERKQSEAEMHRLNAELRELANHLQTIREEERLAVAKEIHDELSQNLVALNMNSVYLKNNVLSKDPKVKDVIEDQITIANNLINASRVLFNSLHPSVLDEIGLLAAIKWYGNNQLKEYKIKVIIHSNVEDVLFPNEISFPLFRIFQEVISNIKLHSKAQNATVSLYKENNVLSMNITDDGIGFDATAIDVINSHGLLGIRERVYAMSGQLQIKSIVGEGTTVKIIVASLYPSEKAT